MLRYIQLDLKQSESDPNALTEEYSKSDDMPEFAVISEKGEQIGPWMRCKDYIQDTVWAGKAKKDCAVYGFSYKHGKDPTPCPDRLMLALRWKSKSVRELSKMLLNTKRVVENLEKRLNIPMFKRTRFSRVKNDYFIISGSPFWMHASQTVSFFSFLIRGSLLNETGVIEESKDSSPVKKDVYYFLSGKPFIKKLLDDGLNSIEPNWGVDTANSLHNLGFVNYSSQTLKSKLVNSQNYGDVKDEDWEF